MPSLNSLSPWTVLPLKFQIPVLASSNDPTLAAEHLFAVEVLLFLASHSQAQPEDLAPMNKYNTV